MVNFKYNFLNNIARFRKKRLPKDFADQILNLEMELEYTDNVDVNILNKLVELYAVNTIISGYLFKGWCRILQLKKR